MTEILPSLKRKYELVIFTASEQEYANKIIDSIEKEAGDENLFCCRLYRENCFKTKRGFFIKDLRIFERDLKDIALVDNSSYSFGFQPKNGIPILSYLGGNKDEEMLGLKMYLDWLSMFDDVRNGVDSHFRFSRFCK